MSQPRRASDLLRGILAGARPDVNHARIQEALEEVLGSEVCSHCQVVGLRSGKLHLQVDSAPLFAELRGFREEEIRTGLNDRLNHQKIAQVVFRMGGTGHV